MKAYSEMHVREGAKPLELTSDATYHLRCETICIEDEKQYYY